MAYKTHKLIIACLVVGMIAAFLIPLIKKPIPVVAAPIMEVDSTVIIIHNSSKNLDSL